MLPTSDNCIEVIKMWRSRTAMSNPRPDRGFCAAQFSFHYSKSILLTDILFMFW